MTHTLPETDALFEQRTREVDKCAVALDEYRVATKRTVLAIKEVTNAVEQLLASIEALAAGPETSENVQELLRTVRQDTAAFNKSDDYVHLRYNLLQHSHLYGESLHTKIRQLTRMGDDRKAASAEVARITRPSIILLRCDAKLLDAKEVLAAKERNFATFYEGLCRSRERTAPILAKAALQSTQQYLASLTEMLVKATTCVRSYLLRPESAPTRSKDDADTRASASRDSPRPSKSRPVLSSVERVGERYVSRSTGPAQGRLPHLAAVHLPHGASHYSTTPSDWCTGSTADRTQLEGVPLVAVSEGAIRAGVPLNPPYAPATDPRWPRR